MEINTIGMFCALAIGAVLGIVIGMLSAKVRSAKTLTEASNALAKSAAETDQLRQRLAEIKEEDEKNLEKQQKNFDETIGKVKAEMEIMTGKVLKERQEEFGDFNKKEMENITSPFKKELEDLRKMINESKSGSEKSMTSLEKTIEILLEHSKQLSNDSKNLTEALKSKGKVIGDWGEFLLANILRASGLREGEDYEIQKNFKNEGKDFRPDVIINTPDGSKIIVDSKATLLDVYTKYIGSENDEDRKEAQKEILKSVWNHVNELSGKYDKIVKNAVPAVLLFVPNEGCFILAMNEDPSLCEKAYHKGIIIVSPTTLMMTLKLIFIIWQNTRQEENYKNIVDCAEKLYDKFATFSGTMVQLGQDITSANKNISKQYNLAIKQLKEGNGNITKRIEELRGFGVLSTKPIKYIPEIKTSDEIPLSPSEDVEMERISV